MFGHLNLSFDNDKEFNIYKCSLCHTLGKEYGIMARLFTNYDMALCLLLSLNINKQEFKTKRHICPMLSVNRILAYKPPALKYAAAITVLLVSEKIKDDMHDEKREVSERMMRWMVKKRKKAEGVLKNFGFDPVMVEKTFENQRALEKKKSGYLIQLMEPSAQVMSEIYSLVAIINRTPEYKDIFRLIGYSIGQIIYLLDSITDYRYDVLRRTFNPLLQCYSCQKENNASIPDEVNERVFYLLKASQRNIERVLKTLPDNSYLTDIFINRLTEKIEQTVKTSNVSIQPDKISIIDKIREITPLSFLFSFTSRYAFASNGKDWGNSCAGSLTFFIIMLIAYGIICKGCCKGRRSSQSDEVTVDHGCGRQKTYKRDPRTGKYRDNKWC